MSAAKWVVAGDSQEYMDWINANGHDRMEWRYVSSPDVLRGTTDPHGIFIGTFYMRTDIRIILLQLQVSTHGTNEALRGAWAKVDIYAPE
jgi:hypothetical protein